MSGSTAVGDPSTWANALVMISPYTFSAIGVSVIGAANYLFVIFCEAVALYGIIVAIILQTKLESVPTFQLYAPESLRAGYAIFASGIIVGFANLVCGLNPLAPPLSALICLFLNLVK